MLLPDFHKSVVQPFELPGLKGTNLSIKRDDLIHPLISGNKWRKLHLAVQKAKKQNAHTLVTFGGAYSNHLVATASAAHLFGFRSIGLIRGEEKQVRSHSLALCKLNGMEIIQVSREAYKDKNSLGNKYTIADGFFLIEEGGRGFFGRKGAQSLVHEIENLPEILALPSGTATTALGICEALEDRGADTEVYVFSSLKNNASDKAQLAPFAHRVRWFDETKFGGYGKFNRELVHYIQQLYKKTGILFDPIYQAKMYYRLEEIISRDNLYHKSILCLHTGGDMGIYSTKFNRLALEV